MQSFPNEGPAFGLGRHVALKAHASFGNGFNFGDAYLTSSIMFAERDRKHSFNWGDQYVLMNEAFH